MGMITRNVVRHGRKCPSCRTFASTRWIPLPKNTNVDQGPQSSHYTLQPHPWRITSKRLYSPQYIPECLCENQALEPYIRTCLSGTLEGTDTHTGCHLWFLGTGGSLPTKSRMTTATMLQLGGQSLLFDAGEGIQRQLMHTRQRLSDLQKIFITHLHADHVLGLPGLLLMAQLAGRDRGTSNVIEIYGPPGIYNYIATTLTLTRSGMSAVHIVVHELVGGDADNDLRKRLQQPNIIHGHFPHLFHNKVLERKSIERNDDGTWTIQTATTPSEFFDVDRGGNRPMNISAAEVTHLNSVQTFGYVVSEPEPTQKIDANKATELGVAPGKKFRKLKNGFSVWSDDGLREVKPEQVLVGANRKVRKIAVIGDNRGLPPAMAELCQNADVMVHEAVSSVQNKKDAHARGHSSPEMAGNAAKRVHALVLALNHISAGTGSEELRDLVCKAEKANGGVSQVVASFDFMELIVPRFGFGTEMDESDVE